MIATGMDVDSNENAIDQRQGDVTSLQVSGVSPLSPPRTQPVSPQPPSELSKTGPRYKLRYTLSGHTRSISSLKFSPDGSILASCGVFTFLD